MYSPASAGLGSDFSQTTMPSNLESEDTTESYGCRPAGIGANVQWAPLSTSKKQENEQA